MSVVGQRLCADAERGDALDRCWCGNLRPAKREHGWTKETAPLAEFASSVQRGTVIDAEEPGLMPCTRPPAGWRCTRGIGHEGPCAAVCAEIVCAFCAMTGERVIATHEIVATGGGSMRWRPVCALHSTNAPNGPVLVPNAGG